MIISRILLMLLIFYTAQVQAAFNGLTIHSRANCVNNESISWDGTRSWILATESFHYYNGDLVHYVGTGWQNTWRSAAIHWGEGNSGGWRVIGVHHIRAAWDGQIRELGRTEATGCNIYNGWWDKK